MRDARLLTIVEHRLGHALLGAAQVMRGEATRMEPPH
jgi:hypothetical protein